MLAWYIDHSKVPPHQLLLQPDLFKGLHLLHVRPINDGDEQLVVCPNCEALVAQGVVGCLQGIHQARKLAVCGAVVGLGGVAEPAAYTADFPAGFATIRVSWGRLLTWLSLRSIRPPVAAVPRSSKCL